jgi:hypothetical protein
MGFVSPRRFNCGPLQLQATLAGSGGSRGLSVALAGRGVRNQPLGDSHPQQPAYADMAPMRVHSM